MSMMIHPAAHTMRARPVEVKSSACRTAITIATSIQTDTASRIRGAEPGHDAEHAQHAGARREARGPEQLSDVDLGLGLGEDLGSKDVDQRSPDHPSEQRHAGPDEQTRAVAGQPDAAGHAGERDHEHGLAGRGLVGLHLLVDGRREAGGADEAGSEGTHACGVYAMLRHSHPACRARAGDRGAPRPGGRSLCRHRRRERLTWPHCAWPMLSRPARARVRPRRPPRRRVCRDCWPARRCWPGRDPRRTDGRCPAAAARPYAVPPRSQASATAAAYDAAAGGGSAPCQRFVVPSSSRPQALRYRNSCVRYAA